MSIISKNTKQFILFLLGCAYVYAGLGWAYIQYKFTLGPVFLSVVGAIFLIVGVIFLGADNRLLYKGISLKKMLSNVIISITFFAVLIGINYLVYKNDTRWDVTRYRQHTLTDYTHQLIEGLSEKISVSVLLVGVPPKYLEDLLREYERQSNGLITFEIIDPIADIGYAARFGNIIKGNEKKVVVQSTDQRQDVDFTKAPLSEELINNALLRVTRQKRTAYFLTGHGEFNIYDEKETGLSSFAKLLEQNNIISKKLMLGITKAIPEDCDVLIVAGAKDDLTDEEIDVVQDYLKKGGDALFLIEHITVSTPDKPITQEEEKKNPSLNEILQNWGMEVGNDVVVDLASHAGEDVGSPATRNYLAHRDIVRTLDYTFYVRPRSISLAKDRRKTLKLAPFILTASDASSSWAETNRYLQIKYDEGIDKPGPVPIGYIAFEPGEDDNYGTRIVVITDADFLTNAYIDAYSNAEMGASVINWLTELDYKVLVDKKEVEVETLNLTSGQKRIIVLILLAIPLLIIMGGLFVWVNNTKTH